MKRKPDIKGYTKNKPYKLHDYTELRLHAGLAFGLCEIEGIRYQEQEDAIVLSHLKIKELPPIIIRTAFKETFSFIQKKFGQVDRMGSTCCSVTAWLDPTLKTIHTWTANLGDSAAFIIIVDEKGHLKKAKNLHPLHDTCEFSASRKLTRGFGDIHRVASGFSHEPDVLDEQLPFKDKDEVFIVVACDGLTECNKITAQKIGEIVSFHQKHSLEEIAEALVNAAYDEGQGSTDNISVGIFKLTETPASLTVFDGHGGCYRGKAPHLKDLKTAQLVKNMSESFYSILNEQIDRILAATLPKKD